MRQLSSTSLAAFRIYEWLTASTTKLPVPLASCRMLLLPSNDEINAEPRLRAYATPWTTGDVLANAAAWRDDASASRANVTLFYFAGHGVQRNIGDSVMLLPGFGRGVGGTLTDAIDTVNIAAGMAPTATRPNIAQTQLYFVDACRVLPEQFRQFERMPTTPVFDLELNSRDDRRAPIFYAAIPGTLANGLRGEQTLFSKALLECLNGAAAEATEEDERGNVKWRVSVHSLDRALEATIMALNAKLGADQEYALGGSQRDADICYLDGPPDVEVTVHIDPRQAVDFGTLEIRDFRDQLVLALSPIIPYPWKKALPAGNYNINVLFDPPRAPYLDFRRLRYVKPLPRELALIATVRP
jgi:hypothetical protein